MVLSRARNAGATALPSPTMSPAVRCSATPPALSMCPPTPPNVHTSICCIMTARRTACSPFPRVTDADLRHVDRDLKALLSLRQRSRRFKVRADNLRIAFVPGLPGRLCLLGPSELADAIRSGSASAGALQGPPHVMSRWLAPVFIEHTMLQRPERKQALERTTLPSTDVPRLAARMPRSLRRGSCDKGSSGPLSSSNTLCRGQKHAWGSHLHRSVSLAMPVSSC